MAEHENDTTVDESTESEETTEQRVEDAVAEVPQESGGSADTPSDEEESTDLDGDALRAELKAARTEAAKYRVKARELNESLSKAKTPEEFEAIQLRASTLETELHRERLSRKYDLPGALAARITGDDDESRDADAKALAEVFHARSGGVGKGGLTPATKPSPTDPKELANLVPRGRRR